ncbi:MAG: glycosyltransferase family 4 protein [Candidatus Parcubacteria bacterium]|nr:glycosyltransferase family 4 protein [Candidatus Parcubacteria bacterium]
MKIAINLSREYVGGITSSNINLINHLYGMDYKFVALELNSRMYIKGPALFRNFAPEVFDHHIINIHHLPIINTMRKAKNIRDVENAYREPIKIIREILREVKPDIVLLSGTYYVPWLISIAAKKEKIPIVLWYSGVLLREIKNQPPHMKKLFSSMEKSIVGRATRIIFPSQLCKGVVEKEVIKHKIKNSYIIPNPIANIFTDPCAVEYSLERRIAAVGRYSKVKNLDAFFALHKELLRRKWRHNACFVTNPDARFKKIPKSIEIIPPMTPEGLKKFYIAQGLIVCPSTFETFGNVPMEAACLGVPVLVSDKMGCSEILNKVGLENMVISFDDIGKVADRAQQLCGQSILPKQLNALKRILDNRLISEEINAVLINVIKRS